MSHLWHHRARKGLVVTAAVLLMGALSGATPAYAAVNCVTSFGVTQTDTTVTGTTANDTIDCGGALPGKTVNGSGGNDSITGTVYVDTLNGDSGNDTMTGAIGNDILNGGIGDDTLTGSAGDDLLNGGTGDDTLTGSEGIDTLKGDDDNDTLNGGIGNDSLDGGPGTDILRGDPGNDSLTGPPWDGRSDSLNGGADTDTCEPPGLLELIGRDVLTDCNP